MIKNLNLLRERNSPMQQVRSFSFGFLCHLYIQIPKLRCYHLERALTCYFNMRWLFCVNMRCCSSGSWALMSRWDVRNRPHSVGGRELCFVLLWEAFLFVCVLVCVVTAFTAWVSLHGCLGERYKDPTQIQHKGIKDASWILSAKH